MPFSPPGLLKNLAQTGTLGGDNFRTLVRVRGVRYLGVIFTPSEPAANQWHRLKHHGKALPEPKAVSMVLLPAGRDSRRVEIRANLCGP